DEPPPPANPGADRARAARPGHETDRGTRHRQAWAPAPGPRVVGVITWRVAAALGAAAVTLPLWPAPWLGVAVYAGLIALVTAVDFAVAAAPSAVRMRRDGARQ